LQLILSAEDRLLDYETATKELEVGVSVIKALEEDGYIRRESSDVYRVPADVQGIPREEEKPLSTAQQEAVDSILKEWAQSDPRPVLLHGVTGSGKTQVYMKLIEQVVASGKQAIVLIPEIALTYQTVRRFYGRFGDRVSVLNSRLSQGERYDQFRRAKAGEIQIMVGPRSALFTPFPALGLIVIDEEHEQTYKSEGSPRYHARETAIHRARMEDAYVILGSATPSMEAYEHAVRGDYKLVRLEHRYGEQTLPKVSVVDLREELRQGNRSVLSRALKAAIEERLTRKEQTMLFLNRRGYAGFVSCRSCGHVMKCPHCDVSLSSHNNGKLVCHYCGYEQPDVQKCPECGSSYIGGFKAGTQQIEQILKKNFPGVRVLRMDYDTTRNKGSYEKILSAFAAHEADILVGTQMIVKGHDFPEVTLVGVLAADLSLNVSDYRSAERTFQLLVQAVGRSGRARKAGEAIIQTYHPDHYSIRTAVSQDYEAFYQEEISYRYLMDYPPGACMLAILASCEDDELLEKASEYLAKYIRRVHPGDDLHMIGPAYAAVGKVNDIYRRVIYLKHADRDILIRIRDQLEKYIEINSGFRKIYIQYDFN
jgi:primosomal protein N' (replication factor Y)